MLIPVQDMHKRVTCKRTTQLCDVQTMFVVQNTLETECMCTILSAMANFLLYALMAHVGIPCPWLIH